MSASLVGVPARAADEGTQTCVAGLRIAIGPPTLDPTRAHRMLEQIAAELGPQTDVHCDDAATRIDVEIGEEKTRVVVEAESGGERRRAERTLDVTTIAEDGRPLAIAIAVDEMAREVHEELTIHPPALPPKPAVARPAPIPLAVAPPPSRGGFGLAIGLDVFTTGVALLGPDARGALFLGSHVALGGRLGVRGVPAWDGGPHEAWSAGLSLALSPDIHAPAGIAGVVGVDALMALSGSRKEVVATAAPSIGGEAWLPLGDALHLTLDARVGAPFTSLHAPRQDGNAAVAAGGALVTTSLGILAIF